MKKVGSALWPDKPLEKAAENLANCLNRCRPEKLDPEQVAFIIREARKQGCFHTLTFISQDAGFMLPQPVEPEDEKAQLQREFIGAAKLIERIGARLEQLGVPMQVVK